MDVKNVTVSAKIIGCLLKPLIKFFVKPKERKEYYETAIKRSEYYAYLANCFAHDAPLMSTLLTESQLEARYRGFKIKESVFLNKAYFYYISLENEND